MNVRECLRAGAPGSSRGTLPGFHHRHDPLVDHADLIHKSVIARGLDLYVRNVDDIDVRLMLERLEATSECCWWRRKASRAFLCVLISSLRLVTGRSLLTATTKANRRCALIGVKSLMGS